jgi:hypothetical protein
MRASVPINLFTTMSSAFFAITILLIPVSSLLDGKREEKRRVLIDFIPNVLSILVNAASYYYANFAGLFRCGNQKVWVKTKHKVTSITYDAEAPSAELDSASAPVEQASSTESAEKNEEATV